MNPLLFADWGRMNRLFTKLMWTVAAIMVCVVFAVLATAGHHPGPATRGQGTGATAAASGGVVRAAGASR
jgi:hypothetical protein